MKPTVPEVAPLLTAYHARHPGGGPLHIFLEDGNVDDGHIEACRRAAEERGDRDAIILADLLSRMSKTQRRKLYRLA